MGFPYPKGWQGTRQYWHFYTYIKVCKGEEVPLVSDKVRSFMPLWSVCEQPTTRALCWITSREDDSNCCYNQACCSPTLNVWVNTCGHLKTSLETRLVNKKGHNRVTWEEVRAVVCKHRRRIQPFGVDSELPNFCATSTSTYLQALLPGISF